VENRRILVTGGAGFIGSHLVAKLVEKGNTVIVLDFLKRGNKIPRKILNHVELIIGDVRDTETVEKAGAKCDLIFHFAAVLGVDIVADNPVETMEVEFLGTKNVANVAIKNNAEKLIYASTSGVYGKKDIEIAVTEDGQLSPATSYAIAKRFNEIYLKSLFEEKGLETTAIRYFNVYGTRQDVRMVIPKFFRQAITNKAITVYGNGRQTRDFTYIDDVTQGTILLAEKSKGFEIFNIARGEEVSIVELAEKINRLCGAKSEIRLVNLPRGRYDFEVDKRIGSSDKLFKRTGFRPHIGIDEGLGGIKGYYQELFSHEPVTNERQKR
jgi:UDP-glucose 4-epimerase